jgi:hypothetical protein
MFDLFLNPANMVIGGALISAPIIIHLINRMRFRRVRWAAMEFLLKSQKRNRRRLIIEQLILLALRCLLVLLTGVLLARFLGFSFANFQPRNTLHVVILDDRLSTEDRWRTEEGELKTSFQVGKQIIDKELAHTLNQARTPQRLVLFRLSEPEVRFDRLINDESLRELTAELGRMESPTALHLDMAKGVETAAEILGQNPQDERHLHIVSDFRQEHWTEPEATRLFQTLQSLTQSGVTNHFVDTAHPTRTENQKTALFHDNFAIIELRAETRVAAENMPVQFTVTVANFSPSERKNLRVTIKVNGEERPEGSLTMLSVPPGRTSTTFQVAFNKLGFQTVTAQLELTDKEDGLPSDNLRYAVIEVRRQVPVLVIDGNTSAGDKPGSDLFHVRTLLTSARGFDVVKGTRSDLERPNLDQYPSIYLLNVAELTDNALKNLENYASGGGGVVFFLGDRVNPDFYNKKLYAGGKGIFPAPLAAQPSKELSEEEMQERQLQNLLEPRMQVYIRSETHPIVAEVYKYRNLMTFLNVNRHFPVPRLRWTKLDDHKVEELVTLPNERPATEYAASTQAILDSLPVDDPQFAKFKAGLEYHKRAIRDSLAGKSLYLLANALDALLRDPPISGEPERVRLTEFWDSTDPKVQALRANVEKFKETVQYGDPLVISSHFNRGRVIAFLTTAGKKWNDWAGGNPASVTYPMIMIELQKYLTGVDVEANKNVGETLVLDRSANRYESKLHCYFQDLREAEAARQPGKEGDPVAKRPGMKDLGDVQATSAGERLGFAFHQARKPGVYQFDLAQRNDASGEARTETVAYAFNVDTDGESDLRRAGWAELEKFGTVHTAEPGTYNDTFKRSSDFSESPWIYLAFLIVLVAEQAMAVHLSFHLKESEAQVPARAVRTQAA